MNLFSLDFETNGLNPYFHDPIEVAIKQLFQEHNFQTLILPKIDPQKPRAGGVKQIVPDKIVELTGITDEHLLKEGISNDHAIHRLLNYIYEHASKDTNPIYIIAHNGTVFDFLFLKRMMKQGNIRSNSTRFGGKDEQLFEMTQRFRYIDTLLLAKLYLKDERVSQHNLCKRYNIVNDSEHRALGDVVTLEKIFIIMCGEVASILKKRKDYFLINPDKICKRLMFE
jgi:DNA polymerase III epsilon subunit-like protein